MGAFGVARLVRQTMAEQGLAQSRFRGLDLDKRKIGLRKEACDLCQNDCTITFADIEGVPGSPSWGYMCGRDPAEQKVRKSPYDRPCACASVCGARRRRGESPGRRAGGGPAASASDLHLLSAVAASSSTRWDSACNVSGQTTDEIRELGPRMAGADFCFPGQSWRSAMWRSSRSPTGWTSCVVPHLKNTPANQDTTRHRPCAPTCKALRPAAAPPWP